MLMYIRDRATGWVAWTIVILISIPFALWGVQEYLSPEQNVAVAEVNGEPVRYQEFQRAYSRLRNNLIQVLGPAASSQMLDEDRLRAQTMQQVINDRVVLQLADNGDMRIGDEQLAFVINNEQAFRQDGRFSQDAYDAYIRSQGLTPVGFEFQLRRELVSQQLGAALDSAAVVADNEVTRLVALLDQKRRYRSLVIDVANFEPETVSESDAKAYFDANRDIFVTPEQVKVQYIEIRRDEIAQAVPVGEEELRARYEAQKADFEAAEQREASHILITLAAAADEAATQAATERVNALKVRLDAGESFEDVAKEASEDPGSSKLGGSLGWFDRGVMDPVFEQAAFALEEDVVSDPVRSTFGFHLIKVTGIKQGEQQPFEEVREQLATAYRNEQAEQEFFDKTERLANAAFENPNTLDIPAAVIDAEIKTSPLFGRVPAANAADSIGRSPRVTEAAFGTDVLVDGNNSELLEMADDRVVVLRVLEHLPSKSQTFEEVRARVEELVKAEQALAAAEKHGSSLLQRLSGGESPEAVAGDAGESATWTEPALIGRSEPEPDLVAAVFSMPRPEEGKVVYHGGTTFDGNYRIVALDRVEDGDFESLPEDQRGQFGVSLASAVGRAEFEALVQAIRDVAVVKVFDQVDN